MIHVVLQRPVEMGKGLGTAREAQAFAQVISSSLAVVAMQAHDARLDCDTLAGHKVGYSRAN